jgi:hypothetical protein
LIILNYDAILRVHKGYYLAGVGTNLLLPPSQIINFLVFLDT